jgi:hypothetical protein
VEIVEVFVADVDVEDVVVHGRALLYLKKILNK